MFISGGGGGLSFPRVDEPLEALILVLIVAALVWLGYRFLSS
jgi:hypothetical protein